MDREELREEYGEHININPTNISNLDVYIEWLEDKVISQQEQNLNLKNVNIKNEQRIEILQGNEDILAENQNRMIADIGRLEDKVVEYDKRIKWFEEESKQHSILMDKFIVLIDR